MKSQIESEKMILKSVFMIMEESILDYAEGKFSRNIHYPSLITLLCIKGGVKFIEEEEDR